MLLLHSIPAGYIVCDPPSDEALRFGAAEGADLLGMKILYNWEGYGWCDGELVEQNLDKERKMGRHRVTFLAEYSIDASTDGSELPKHEHMLQV